MIRIRAFDGGEFGAYLGLPEGGRGPGLVMLPEMVLHEMVNPDLRALCDFFASRGFVAICPDLFWRIGPGREFNEAKAVDDAGATLEYLRSYEACTGRAGAVGYGLGGKLAYLLAVRYKPDASVGYYGAGIDQALGEAGNLSGPLMLHLVGQDRFGTTEIQQKIQSALGSDPRVTLCVYPNAHPAFARKGGDHYDPQAAELADLRTLDFLRTILAQPEPLEKLWGEHVAHEFTTQDTEQTLATMVEDAYVNHIPVMTGGIGKEQLREFYSKHFIPHMPPDTTLTPISRTVGDHQLVDEMLFRFTHTIRMDWMLPGVEPTGKRIEVPLVAIVKFRDGKLAHEHIYWDQASVLAQIGWLDPSKLPIAGVESARKAADPKLPARPLP